MFMLWMLAFVICIAIGVTVMYLGVRWGSHVVAKEITAQLQATATIVENQQIPEDWIQPYRQRIAHMRATGQSEEDIERVVNTARQHCLKRIDTLAQFFRKTNITDTPDTREEILNLLAEQRARWTGAEFKKLIEQAGEKHESTHLN